MTKEETKAMAAEIDRALFDKATASRLSQAQRNLLPLTANLHHCADFYGGHWRSLLARFSSTRVR